MQNQNRTGSIYFNNRINTNSTYKPLQVQAVQQQMPSDNSLTCTTYKSYANLNTSHNSGNRLLGQENPTLSKTTTRYTLNSLWSIWYGLVVILFQVYIIIRNVQRFTSYLELPWPVKHEPFFQLNAYVILTAIGVVIMPFFFVSTVVRIGNYPNDGVKLGSNKNKTTQSNKNKFESDYEVNRNLCSVRSVLSSWWKHFPPLMGLLHFASAACFLSAHCLMEAELIKHGFLSKETIWKTELDFALNRIENTSLTQSFINNLHSILNNQTFSNHQLILLKQTEATNMLIQRPLILPENEVEDKLHLTLGQLSSEYINFLASLLIIAIRYPTVFWHINKLFGLIFSAQLIINAFINLIAYSVFSMYFKLRIYGVERVLVRYQAHFSLNLTSSIFLFVLYTITVQASSSAVYYYGLKKYKEFLQRKRFQIEHHNFCTNLKNLNTLINQQANDPIFNNRQVSHIPHFFAFLVLLLLSLTAILLMYDFFIIYFSTMQTKMLISSLLMGFHCLEWMLLWILFTCKQNWIFNITSTDLNTMMTTPNSIYGIATDDKLKSVSSTGTTTNNVNQNINYGLLATVTNPQLKSCLKATVPSQLGRSMLNLNSLKANNPNSVYGHVHASTSIQQRQQQLRASMSKPSLSEHSYNGTATPVRSLYNNRDAYSDSEGLNNSTSTSKKFKKLGKFGKFSFKEKSSQKNEQMNSSTLPNLTKKQRKLRLRKKTDLVNEASYDSETDYTDYSTFKKVVRRENTDDNLTTHMNLCPLQNDRGYLSDYDVLCMRKKISNNFQSMNPKNQSMNKSPLPDLNAIYGTNKMNYTNTKCVYDQVNKNMLNMPKQHTSIPTNSIYGSNNNQNLNIYGTNTMPMHNNVTMNSNLNSNSYNSQTNIVKNHQQILSNSIIYQGLQSIKEHFNTVSDSDTSSGIHSATTGSIISTTPTAMNFNSMLNQSNMSTSTPINKNSSQRSDSVENLINCIQAPKPFLKSLSMTRQAANNHQHQIQNQQTVTFNQMQPLPPPPMQTKLDIHNMIFEPPNLNVPELIAINNEQIYGCKTNSNLSQQTPLSANDAAIHSGVYGRIGSNQMSTFSLEAKCASLPHGKQQQQKQLNMNTNCNTISTTNNHFRQTQMLPPPPQHMLQSPQQILYKNQMVN